MSPRRWIERVKDILEAILEIQSFTQGMDFEAFQNDLRTIRAIELDFIIIGEAANAIPDEVVENYPQIPWILMKSMRNRLVHVYFSVAPKILWETIQQDLPPITPLLNEILDTL
jgi:uncharacterized protein with HEPN domain